MEISDGGMKRPRQCEALRVDKVEERLGFDGFDAGPNHSRSAAMPRYFFDVYDSGSTALDDVGIELKDDQAARDEGMIGLAEMLREYVTGGAPQKDMTMRVRNETGVVVEIALTFAIKSEQ